MTMPAARPLALFVSDVHLQAAHPATSRAFLDFLAQRASTANALYILGDLFEYWAGDDDLEDPFHHTIVQALRRVSDAGTALYWIAGNRDFLVGHGFAQATGATLLSEPFVLELAGRRIVILHGDAECTADIAYMEFRTQVRDPQWQAQFLALPVSQRKAIVAGLREKSRAHQGEQSDHIMDVTAQAIAQVFAATRTSLMIHGHTHRPALHTVGATRRYVLPDWECDEAPLRGGWIALQADGSIERWRLDDALSASIQTAS